VPDDKPVPPPGDDPWWLDGGRADAATYMDDIASNEPFPDWDDLIDDWKSTDAITSSDFHMTDALDYLNGYSARGFVAACYGGYRQTGPTDPPKKFVMIAIETTLLYDYPTTKFSAFKDYYEDAVVGGEGHLIPSFSPHPSDDGCP